MGFRIVDRSSVTFTFETDIPLSSRNIHPSGVLHAFRSTPPKKGSTSGGTGSAVHVNREEQTFAWVANCLNIDSALDCLENRGFDRYQGIVFVPYSTKNNFCDQYPHAEFALDCADNGKCHVLVNKRPHPKGSGKLQCSTGEDGGKAIPAEDRISKNDDNNIDVLAQRKRKYEYKRRAAANMFQDKSYIPDRERDELHIEIYNYLSWLHAKVGESDRKVDLVELEEKEEKEDSASSEEDEVDHGEQNQAGNIAVGQQKNNHNRYGLDVSELQNVLDKLESTFLIIPNVKLELEAAAAAAAAAEEEDIRLPQQQQGDQQQGEEAGEEQPLKQELLKPKAPVQVPLLEKALSTTLQQVVEARELAGGQKRRSRKRLRVRDKPKRKYSIIGGGFDEMFRRLVQYKEEHGDCLVPRSRGAQSPDERKVNSIRNRKSTLMQKGLECEEILPGKKTLTKSLTAERLERLNAIDFVWSVMAPKVAWEDRFQDCIEYHAMNNKWPTQSMGSLGEWVHKQRTLYAKKEVNYMKHYFPKLDEVGFEWTPRGNTKLTWETGLGMLLEYGKINGHYDVQCPTCFEESGGVDFYRSAEFRFYRWVESLHSMYRSYKLGRQSGSLTHERVLLLIKHGFAFRND